MTNTEQLLAYHKKMQPLAKNNLELAFAKAKTLLEKQLRNKTELSILCPGAGSLPSLVPLTTLLLTYCPHIKKIHFTLVDLEPASKQIIASGSTV